MFADRRKVNGPVQWLATAMLRPLRPKVSIWTMLLNLERRGFRAAPSHISALGAWSPIGTEERRNDAVLQTYPFRILRILSANPCECSPSDRLLFHLGCSLCHIARSGKRVGCKRCSIGVLRTRGTAVGVATTLREDGQSDLFQLHQRRC